MWKDITIYIPNPFNHTIAVDTLWRQEQAFKCKENHIVDSIPITGTTFAEIVPFTDFFLMSKCPVKFEWTPSAVPAAILNSGQLSSRLVHQLCRNLSSIYCKNQPCYSFFSPLTKSSDDGEKRK